jgi:hypothetical protein
MSLWVVVGDQYDSEGKGKIAAYLARREDIDIWCPCGKPELRPFFPLGNANQPVTI